MPRLRGEANQRAKKRLRRFLPARILIGVAGALGGALWGFGVVLAGALLESGFGIVHGSRPLESLVAAMPFVLRTLRDIGPEIALTDAMWMAPLFWGAVGLTLVDLRSRWMAAATLVLVGIHGWGVYLFQARHLHASADWWLNPGPGAFLYLIGLGLMAPLVTWKIVVLARALPEVGRLVGVARRSSRTVAMQRTFEGAGERSRSGLRSGLRKSLQLPRSLGSSRAALLVVVLACLITIVVVRWQLRWTGHYFLPPGTAIGAGFLLRFGLPFWLAPHLVGSVSWWLRHRSSTPSPDQRGGNSRLLFDLLAAALWVAAFISN